MCTDVSDWLSVLKFFFHFADCTIYVQEKGGEVGVLISLFPLLVMQKCFINPNSLCYCNSFKLKYRVWDEIWTVCKWDKTINVYPSRVVSFTHTHTLSYLHFRLPLTIVLSYQIIAFMGLRSMVCNCSSKDPRERFLCQITANMTLQLLITSGSAEGSHLIWRRVSATWYSLEIEYLRTYFGRAS